MRTTLTLDADVARSLTALVRRRKMTFKQTVNDALRTGLGLQTARRPRGRFVVKAHAGGFKAGLDPYKLNHLTTELEDEATLRAMARR
ncbi:MAG TPA: antitoxin [Verrucomicrobiota bacterium]|nr:antitoxin [Verrucomicrobiales bacterium]HRI13270.1 antitoxin [Verrucomicrobiota bacterium]